MTCVLAVLPDVPIRISVIPAVPPEPMLITFVFPAVVPPDAILNVRFPVLADAILKVESDADDPAPTLRVVAAAPRVTVGGVSPTASEEAFPIILNPLTVSDPATATFDDVNVIAVALPDALIIFVSSRRSAPTATYVLLEPPIVSVEAVDVMSPPLTARSPVRRAFDPEMLPAKTAFPLPFIDPVTWTMAPLRTSAFPPDDETTATPPPSSTLPALKLTRFIPVRSVISPEDTSSLPAPHVSFATLPMTSA